MELFVYLSELPCVLKWKKSTDIWKQNAVHFECDFTLCVESFMMWYDIDLIEQGGIWPRIFKQTIFHFQLAQNLFILHQNVQYWASNSENGVVEENDAAGVEMAQVSL